MYISIREDVLHSATKIITRKSLKSCSQNLYILSKDDPRISSNFIENIKTSGLMQDNINLYRITPLSLYVPL